jgi:hypothetical protein
MKKFWVIVNKVENFISSILPKKLIAVSKDKIMWKVFFQRDN